jgi:predicted O-linked N-acetylglucosamine transferase (SPINDLY family)
VIGIIGGTFASRVATSLNTAVGLNDLLNCDTRKCYVNAAIEYCNKFVHSKQYARGKIQDSRGKTLFNSSLFATSLEYAYHAIQEIRYLTNNGKQYHVISSPHLYM